MTSEAPFLLKQDEQIITDSTYILYYGVGYATTGFYSAGMAHGLIGGISTAYTRKMEKSIHNAVDCHPYLTNKRLVFLKSNISLLTGKETKIEGIMSDIPLENIEAAIPSTKFLFNPTIDVSVRSANGEIDLISFAFLVRSIFQERTDERDNFLELLKKHWNMARARAKVSTNGEDPINIIKNRLAKGEITFEQYQKMMEVLSN